MLDPEHAEGRPTSNQLLWLSCTGPHCCLQVLAIFLPFSAFVALGFEHCIANMCTIPLAVMLGADVTVGECF